MKKNLFIYSVVLLFAVSCSAPTPEYDNTLPEVKTVEAPVTENFDDGLPQLPQQNGVALNPPHGEPGHDCNISVGAPLNGSAAPIHMPSPVIQGSGNPSNISSPSGVRLNPPHGEPGHDCNIEVGQPLS